MAEYLIQEETLTEIADIIREQFEHYDAAICLISDRKDLINITIPDGTTNIGKHAFRQCLNLKSITIPKSITAIKSQAFWNCTKLTDMYLYPTTPPTLSGIDNIPTTTTVVHVPVGSGDAYKVATNWSSFNIIVEDIVIE